MSARSILLTLWSWAVVGLVALRVVVGLRAPVVVAYVLFGPGLALCSYLPRSDGLTRLVTVVASSLALGVIVSESLALGHLFSGLNSMIILAGVTSVLALGQGLRRSRGLEPASVGTNPPLREGGTN